MVLECAKHLIRKYNVPGPRYTSYPTVPYWKNDHLNSEQWLETFNIANNDSSSQELSIYIHLPYCESLCTFCGCHKRITKNHAVEVPYIDAVLKEWQLYKAALPFIPKVMEIHLGGGTPTFFNPSELERLIKGILENQNSGNGTQLGFEAHPNNTNDAHLTTLYSVGFRRLSLGIQDYSATVQKAIHRIQPFDQVKRVHHKARAMGYTSISHDLVYGLPKQTLNDIIDTVEKTIELMPDRIALYSYAHVPWIKGVGQRGYDENDLPKDEVKRELYETARERLFEAGYKEIGMDHFALEHDELYQAFLSKTLHRNFMGYTTKSAKKMVGLGMSAISDSWYGFAQNDKTVEGYLQKINEGMLPIFRGHLLSEKDLIIRQHILDLMCHFETRCSAEILASVKERLHELIQDNIVQIDGNTVRILEGGVPFVRNCCMAFDEYLINDKGAVPMFSKTI
jgi:oxygen-independent coproporphyrinogen-3 oxidase